MASEQEADETEEDEEASGASESRSKSCSYGFKTDSKMRVLHAIAKVCPTGFHNDDLDETEPTKACVVVDCRNICHAECSMKAFRDLAMFDHAGDEEEAKNGWGKFDGGLCLKHLKREFPLKCSTCRNPSTKAKTMIRCGDCRQVFHKICTSVCSTYEKDPGWRAAADDDDDDDEDADSAVPKKKTSVPRHLCNKCKVEWGKDKVNM
jgi:hypothetical protein